MLLKTSACWSGIYTRILNGQFLIKNYYTAPTIKAGCSCLTTVRIEADMNYFVREIYDAILRCGWTYQTDDDDTIYYKVLLRDASWCRCAWILELKHGQ